MLFLIIVTVMSKTCQEVLKSQLSTDLVPRINKFRSNQGGLDSIKNYPECLKLPNSTFVTILWKLGDFYNTHYGFCLPSHCTEEVSLHVINSFISSNNYTNLLSDEGYDICLIPNNEPKIDFSRIFFLSSFVLILICGIIGTIINLIHEKSEFWKCFSVIENTKKLLNFNEAYGDLQFFDGIRAISSFSIVFLHYIYLSIKTPSAHRSELLQQYKILSLLFFTSYSVDIFFFLAGVVMTISTVQELNKREGKLNWIRHIVRRMTRYYPIYLFVVGLSCVLEGLPPPTSQLVPIHCEFSPTFQDWVKSLVFLHALFPSTSTIYMIFTWSIAYDFYFYLLSSVVLFVYYNKKTLGYLAILTLITFSIIYTSIISYTHNLSPLFSDLLLNKREMNLVYFNPICRVSSYIVGNVFGLIYLASKKKEAKVSVAYEVKDGFGDIFERNCLRLCKSQQVRTCFYVSGFGIFCFLCSWPAFLAISGKETVGFGADASFLGLQRVLIGLACALLFLPSALGHLNPFIEVLKIKAFILPSRLSYAVYLIHPFVISTFFMAGNHEKVWLNFEFIYGSMLTYAISIIFGGVLHVFIESPILALEKKLFR